MTASSTRRSTLTLIGSIVLSLASVFPVGAGMVPAKEEVTFTQTRTFAGQNWRLSVTATDLGSDDGIVVSLDRPHVKKDNKGRVVYNLRESHVFVFRNLADSTVELNDDLTGTIDVGNQIPGVLTGTIMLNAIQGEAIKETCNGATKQRKVRPTGNSKLTLKTGNDLFKNLLIDPSDGRSLGTNGNCDVPDAEPLCPARSTYINGFVTDSTTGQFGWTITKPVSGRLARLDLNLFRGLDGGHIYDISLNGRVLNKFARIEKDLSAGYWHAAGVPRLSGSGYIVATETAQEDPPTGCGPGDRETWQVERAGTPGGNLAFTPSGDDKVSMAQEWETEFGNVARVRVGDD